MSRIIRRETTRTNSECEIQLWSSTILKFEYYGHNAMSTKFKYRYIEITCKKQHLRKPVISQISPNFRYVDEPQLLQKCRYPNLISQILRVGQFYIDVYSISTFKMINFLQIPQEIYASRDIFTKLFIWKPIHNYPN